MAGEAAGACGCALHPHVTHPSPSPPPAGRLESISQQGPPPRAPRLPPPVSEYFLNWVSWSSPGKENKPGERARTGGTGLGEDEGSSSAVETPAASQLGGSGLRGPPPVPSCAQLCPCPRLHRSPVTVSN